jgi:hypothetical protein
MARRGACLEAGRAGPVRVHQAHFKGLCLGQEQCIGAEVEAAWALDKGLRAAEGARSRHMEAARGPGPRLRIGPQSCALPKRRSGNGRQRETNE